MANSTLEELYRNLEGAKEEQDDLQTQIYIIAATLGAINLCILIALFALVFVITRLKKSIEETDRQFKIEQELRARRFSGYTGEEIHRKLATIAVAPPILAGKETTTQSEYAFNTKALD